MTHSRPRCASARLAAALAALALACCPAAAFAQSERTATGARGYGDVAASNATGYFGGSYEYTELEDADTDGFGISGAVAFDSPGLSRLAGTNVGIQLDAGYVSGDDDSDAISAVAHVFTRSQPWLFGAYVSAADVDDVEAFGFGGEINRYYQRFTLAGTGGWTLVDDIDTDLFSLAGEVRYFLGEDLRIDGGIGWADIDVEGSESEDAITLSLGGERKFGATPFSAYANFTTAVFDDDIDANQFSLGVRYSFAPTLRERERSGPSLNQPPLATRLLF